METVSPVKNSLYPYYVCKVCNSEVHIDRRVIG